ncbi:MAG: acyloxyacyl hydrolase [Alphaproteobacteria bacterium]|nr:acyloxyacyl hydrolase [Rhodospirillales bacterium]MCW9045440.1 acyloxyacyl hydrolase [Alphaproteobacteria bacterium]
MKTLQSKGFIAIALVTAFLTTKAFAEEARPLQDVPLLKGGIGYFDINKKDNTATELRLEYMGRKFYKAARPLIGISSSSDKSFYAFAGVAFDFGKDNYYFTPSFAPGYYHKGDGKDLGHNFEFRTQVELGYEFENASRLGLSASHQSNAHIGDNNPGAETVSVYYSIPLNGF